MPAWWPYDQQCAVAARERAFHVALEQRGERSSLPLGYCGRALHASRAKKNWNTSAARTRACHLVEVAILRQGGTKSGGLIRHFARRRWPSRPVSFRMARDGANAQREAGDAKCNQKNRFVSFIRCSSVSFRGVGRSLQHFTSKERICHVRASEYQLKPQTQDVAVLMLSLTTIDGSAGIDDLLLAGRTN